MERTEGRKCRPALPFQACLLILAASWLVALAGVEASASLVNIVTYTFDGNTKNFNSKAADITASTFESYRNNSASFETGNPGTGKSFADNHWKTGGNYFYFSVVPAAGYKFNIAGLQFDDLKDSSLGNNWEVGYRLGGTDQFSPVGSDLSHLLHQSNWGSNTLDLSGISALQNATDTVTFQIKAVNNISNDTKKWRVDNVVVTGDVQILPEPATICLLGLGALGLLRKRRA